jgi:L-iditol 2-dehydrogenase
MSGRMKAAVLHKPKDLRYEEVRVPAAGENEVLIRVRAAGNCGSDLKRIMVEGTYHFPCIPGHEFSGEIAETGRGVKDLKAGDRVTAAPMIPCMRCGWCLQGQYNMCDDYDYVGSRSDGAFAEYVKVPAANVVRLPEGVDFEDGSMTDPAAVALHAIRRAGGVTAGETVVVLGAGPIGMLACQWAKLLGAEKVIATDVFEAKLSIVRNLGADVTVHAGKSDVVQRILAETRGAGADLLIETAGTLDTHVQALLAARKRGRVVHVGRAYRDMLLSDEVFTKVFRKELVVYGAVNSNFSPLDHEWETVVRYFAAGKIAVKALVSHRLPLSAAADSFRKMFDREMEYNKIIFSP